jgi:hypothetical protein
MSDDDRQERMSRRLREWSDHHEKAMARQFYRSRQRQDEMERRLREQVCAMVREQTQADVC